MKTFKGYDIFKNDYNSIGLKYYAQGIKGKLRANSLTGIKILINNEILKEGK